MKMKRLLAIAVLAWWCLLPSPWGELCNAQESDSAEHNNHLAGMGAVAPADTSPQLIQVQLGQMSEHHHHRPAVLPPEEDKAYSELNHHVAGVFVLLAGGLALLATIGGSRFSWTRYGWPGLFFLLGIFLFVRLDPESWPWGPLSFGESVREVQVLQHMLFICIVWSIGIIEWFRCRGTLSHPAWGWVFPALALSGAVMLFMHKHGEGPAAEKIYRHHAIMAVSGIVAMIAKVFDDSQLFNSKIGGYVWTCLIMFVGVMLLFYAE